MFEQLAELEKLQDLDIALNAIEKKKGALPQDIQSIENELSELKQKLENLKKEVAQSEEAITAHRKKGKELEGIIKKLRKDQENVKSDQEYEAISRELELQELDQQFEKKNIKTCHHEIAEHEETILEIKSNLETREKLFESKKQTLATIDEANKEQEDKLRDLHEKQIKKIKDGDLLKRYEKIRDKKKQMISVVSGRGACRQCSYVVPTQKQVEIRKSKKIIVCENCGCILIRAEKPAEEITTTTKRKPRARKKTA